MSYSSELANGQPQGQAQSQEAVPWLELFSQHESNINNHLELCSKIRCQMAPSTISFHAISAMVYQSQRFMEEIKKIRHEFILQSTATRPVTRSRGSKQSGIATKGMRNDILGSKPSSNGENLKPVFDTDATPSTATQRSQNRRKRSRNSGDSFVTGSNSVVERTIIKKPKSSLAKSPAEEGGFNESDLIPPIELEDISNEVEARLKLREETRRKKREKQRKRKRESIESLGAGSRAKKVKNS